MTRARIPLIGSYNTRVGATNALSSASGVVGVGLVGAMIVNGGTGQADKDQRFINCFPAVVRNPLSGKPTVYLMKRPGFASNATPQAGSIGNAILVWSGQGSGGKVMSAFGATNSSIYEGTTRLVTDNGGDTTIITGKATGITETSLSNTATLVISSSDNTAWYYQDSGTVTKITDAQFPGNNSLTLAGTFAHLDGYAFIMATDGNIYHSDINSLTAWGGLYIGANTYPDKGVACIRHRNRIIGFGPQSMEFFYNAGNTVGSPLSRIDNLAQQIGLVNADALVNWRDSLFWAGSSPQGGVAVYTMSDTAPQRISTAEIEQQLVLAGTSNISLSVVSYFGRMHLYVKASGSTFAYCVESQSWYEIVGAVPLWTKTSAVSVGSTIATYAVSNVSTSGKTFIVNPAAHVFRDNGEVYTATMRTSQIDLGTNKRKTWRELDIIGDVEESTSNLSVTWTDDDYNTYADARTVDLSSNLRQLKRLGNSRRRAFAFAHSANTPMRIEAMEIEADVGTV